METIEELKNDIENLRNSLFENDDKYYKINLKIGRLRGLIKNFTFYIWIAEHGFDPKINNDGFLFHYLCYLKKYIKITTKDGTTEYIKPGKYYDIDYVFEDYEFRIKIVFGGDNYYDENNKSIFLEDIDSIELEEEDLQSTGKPFNITKESNKVAKYTSQCIDLLKERELINKESKAIRDKIKEKGKIRTAKMEVEHNIKCDIRIDDGTKEISEKNIWKC